MKLLYFALAVIYCTCVRAQNDYQLFRPGVQYLYDNPDYVDNPFAISSQYYGVRVDSLGCTPLYQSLGTGDAGQPSPCVYKEPSPFGYSICQTADSTVMDFQDDNPFVLYHSAEVGERWVAQQLGVRLTAEVLAIDSADVLGLPDLVKTIGIYANDTTAIGNEIRISRRYGLLDGARFYEFATEISALELVGRSTPTAGLQLPEAAAYGLAAVGDTFQIEQYYFGGEPFGSSGRYSSRYSSFTILDVDTTTQADRYNYVAQADIYQADQSTGGIYQPVALDTTVSFSIERLPQELSDAQPGEAIIPEGSDSSTLILVNVFLQEAGLVSLRPSTPVHFGPNDDCGFDESQVDGGPGGVYTEGVPVTLEDISGQSGPQSSILRYYSSGDVRYGTFRDSVDITNSTKEALATFSLEVKLYPNPVSKLLHLELPGTEQYNVRLYNLAGTQVQGQWLRGGTVADLAVSALPAGPYFLVVFANGSPVGRRRLIVE